MKPITVIGCGPGNPAYLLPIATDTIRMQQYVCGSPRLLTMISAIRNDGVVLPGEVEAAMAVIQSLKPRGTTGILVSGDPTVFSICDIVKRRFSEDINGVVPGIGAGQLAMNRLGISAADATLISLHGRVPDPTLSVSPHGATLFYMGGSGSFRWLDNFASAAPQAWQWHFCGDLSLPTEQIFEMTPGNFYSAYRKNTVNGLAIVVCRPTEKVNR